MRHRKISNIVILEQVLMKTSRSATTSPKSQRFSSEFPFHTFGFTSFHLLRSLRAWLSTCAKHRVIKESLSNKALLQFIESIRRNLSRIRQPAQSLVSQTNVLHAQPRTPSHNVDSQRSGKVPLFLRQLCSLRVRMEAVADWGYVFYISYHEVPWASTKSISQGSAELQEEISSLTMSSIPEKFTT